MLFSYTFIIYSESTAISVISEVAFLFLLTDPKSIIKARKNTGKDETEKSSVLLVKKAYKIL